MAPGGSACSTFAHGGQKGQRWKPHWPDLRATGDELLGTLLLQPSLTATAVLSGRGVLWV